MTAHELDFMPLAKFVDHHPSRCYDEFVSQHARFQIERIKRHPPIKHNQRQDWSVALSLSGWRAVDVHGAYARELMALVPPVDWGCWHLRLLHGKLDIRREYVPKREQFILINEQTTRHKMWVGTCAGCNEVELVMCCDETWREVYGGEV